MLKTNFSKDNPSERILNKTKTFNGDESILKMCDPEINLRGYI